MNLNTNNVESKVESTLNPLVKGFSHKAPSVAIFNTVGDLAFHKANATHMTSARQILNVVLSENY